jgi:hypothetical protein
MPSRAVTEKCIISDSCAVGGFNTLTLPTDYGLAEFVNAYVYTYRKAIYTGASEVQ